MSSLGCGSGCLAAAVTVNAGAYLGNVGSGLVHAGIPIQAIVHKGADTDPNTYDANYESQSFTTLFPQHNFIYINQKVELSMQVLSTHSGFK